MRTSSIDMRTIPANLAAALALAVHGMAQAGSLDPTLGTGGKVTTGFFGMASLDYGADAMAIQDDGKIVVVGTRLDLAGSDFALARYNTDGTLDGGFGSAGRVTTDFGYSLDRALAVAIQGDRKIVAAGYTSSGGHGFGLARYNADGSLDGTFGTGGKVTTQFNGWEWDYAYAVAIQSDGKIIAAGGYASLVMARYNVDGSLDGTFGSGGKIIGTTSVAFAAQGLAIQSDRKIVVAGGLGPRGGFVLARFHADGSLDGAFGTGGTLTTNFGHMAYAVVTEPDGNIVAAGKAYAANTGWDFALVRYNSDGNLDANFGSGGQVTTDFGYLSSEDARAVAIQPDRKIVVVGTAYRPSTGWDFALARYHTNGTLDGSFGSGGLVTTDFAEARTVAIQADGKILAAGYGSSSSGGPDFSLVRYNTDGTLDGTFGSAGKVTTDFGGRAMSRARSILAMQADGKIVAAGQSHVVTGGSDFALARYNADGSLDGSFGSGGQVTTDFGSVDHARALALQADGKIVALGVSWQDFALARYNVDGSLDASFGGGGRVVTDFGSLQDDRADAVAIQTDGKIVALGTRWHDLTDFALARYNADGSLDDSFGSHGRVTTSFGSLTYDSAHSIAIQADGRIVAVGGTSGPGGGLYSYSRFALARYNADGSLDGSLRIGDASWLFARARGTEGLRSGVFRCRRPVSAWPEGSSGGRSCAVDGRVTGPRTKRGR